MTSQHSDSVQNSYQTPSAFTVQQDGYDFFRTVHTTCNFNVDIFHEVMDNLVRNPNITSSHLFRADIFWDSEKDSSFSVSPDGELTSTFLQYMKPELRAKELHRIGDYELKRSLVRQLIPRNTKLDRPLVQTCHFYRCVEDNSQRSLVFYIPHVTQVSDIPWYHPPVKSLAFLHSWEAVKGGDDTGQSSQNAGDLSIHTAFFESSIGSIQSEQRLARTLENLLSTICKHGKGKLQGYKKRVHHDNVIPQARLQDTYTRLKNKYAKTLLQLWSEQTDATKGVFEDLGIAAFLIELWSDMYTHKALFPGFVDIACGNGILVYILLEEGYQGWGFDARERKTWHAFPTNVRENLKPFVFVPRVFTEVLDRNVCSDFVGVHDGVFEDGTFIVSNHADELTMWTPLLAYMNKRAPFIAIPCCSHDFAGAKTRFRTAVIGCEENATKTGVPNESSQNFSRSDEMAGNTGNSGQINKQASAYSALCSAVSRITSEIGYMPETEMLRIPSTRNFAVVGRKSAFPSSEKGTSEELDERIAKITHIIEREMGRSITNIAAEWVERAEKLVNSKGRNH